MDLGGVVISSNFAESCCFKTKKLKRGIDIQHDSSCMFDLGTKSTLHILVTYQVFVSLITFVLYTMQVNIRLLLLREIYLRRKRVKVHLFIECTFVAGSEFKAIVLNYTF